MCTYRDLLETTDLPNTLQREWLTINRSASFHIKMNLLAFSACKDSSYRSGSQRRSDASSEHQSLTILEAYSETNKKRRASLTHWLSSQMLMVSQLLLLSLGVHPGFRKLLIITKLKTSYAELRSKELPRRDHDISAKCPQKDRMHLQQRGDGALSDPLAARGAMCKHMFESEGSNQQPEPLLFPSLAVRTLECTQVCPP